MRVINLLGGPGAGKTTSAAGLFVQMKLQALNCELVTEYAKDLTWEKRHAALADQLYVLAKQNRRLERLRNQVDWIITDSPLILSLIYAPQGYLGSYFHGLVMDLWGTYDNTCYFIDRVKEYSPIGRNQNEQDAKLIDEEIRILCFENNIHTKSIPGDWETPQRIMTNLGLVKKEETNGKSTTDGVSEIHPPKQIQSVAE